MKKLLFVFLTFASCQVFAQQSFTCQYGGRPACLGFNDRVVDQSSICFRQGTCFSGFVCKNEFDDLVMKYNDLVRKNNTLISEHDDLVRKYNDLIRKYNDK